MMDIEKLAREAGLLWAGKYVTAACEDDVWRGDLRRFASLVAEEAAKVCESLTFTENGPSPLVLWQRKLCAAAIRERFKA